MRSQRRKHGHTLASIQKIACVQVGRWVMISSIYTTVCHGSSARGYSWQFSLAPPFSLAPLVRSISPSPLSCRLSSHSPFIFPSSFASLGHSFGSSTTPARDGSSFHSPRFSLSRVHPERRLLSSLSLLDAPSNSPGDLLTIRETSCPSGRG